MDREIVRHNQALLQARSPGKAYTFAGHGPAEYFPDRRLAGADIWQRSALGLDALAKGMGARYLHLLQPNQYVRGSKPMGPKEQEAAMEKMDGWPDKTEKMKDITVGYALLRQRGQQLKAAGVDFVDLSTIFKDVTAPLYVDECCHLNQKGNDHLARAMAEQARRVMTPAP